MRHYGHLTLCEREDIMLMRREGKKITEIAAAIGRSKSTVSRELARNSCQRFYRASTAQARYEKRREPCRRTAILDDDQLFSLVGSKFLEEQWSPEQIEGRLALELNASPVSDSTIYRAIAVGRFDGLIGGKSLKKVSAQVSKVMIRALRHQPLHTVTPDRGKEFAAHAAVTEALGVEFYFASPHHPWERGTNENTNGLLREYFPKGRPFDKIKIAEVKRVYDKLNKRPRKRLGYRTPYEVHYGKPLHLI